MKILFFQLGLVFTFPHESRSEEFTIHCVFVQEDGIPKNINQSTIDRLLINNAANLRSFHFSVKGNAHSKTIPKGLPAFGIRNPDSLFMVMIAQNNTGNGGFSLTTRGNKVAHALNGEPRLVDYFSITRIKEMPMQVTLTLADFQDLNVEIGL